jgi:membrane peptidoglycan carboxypeptidase
VRLAEEVGREAIATFAREAGIASHIALEPSMALGTVALSPLELVSAYTTFAGLGRRVEPRIILRVESQEGELLWEAEESPRRRVIEPAVAYLVNDVLSDAMSFGSGAPARAAGFHGHAAGKTGTSNEGIDAWFIGYNPEIVAGVWIGFDQPRSILRNASGGRLAAPVWGRMMARYYRGREEPDEWPRPSNVVVRDVDPESGLVLEEGCWPSWGEPYSEMFIRGMEPRSVCPQEESDSLEFQWSFVSDDTSLADSLDEALRDEEIWGGETLDAHDREAEEIEVALDERNEEREDLPARPSWRDDDLPAPGARDERFEGVDDDAGPRDLGGWWQVTHRVESSLVPEYDGLRLGFRVFLRQEGNRISGEGEKWTEDGDRLPPSQRSSISLTGTIEGTRVRVRFTEHGSRRTSSGTINWTIRDGGSSLTGQFVSDAAQARGPSVAQRIP